MTPRGMPTVGGRNRMATHGLFVAWLVAVVGCSSSTPPTQPGSPAASSPTSGTGGPAVPSAAHSASSGPTESRPLGRPSVATVPPKQPTLAAPKVTLNGPFGSVDAGPRDPGSAPPVASGLDALDAYVRSAPLTVTFIDPDLTFSSWNVSASPAVLHGSDEELAVRPYPDASPELLRITGPPAGDWLLRADVTSMGRVAASYFWRLTVPDRDLPPDGHVIVPAPRALLGTSDATVRGVPGSGCYVDTCVDVGRDPPIRQLEQLTAAPGDSLTLRSSDASRFVLWSTSVTPVRVTGGTRPVVLDRGADPAGVEEATFRAPGRGDWYVSITISFDRRRGSYTYFTRLTIP